MLPVSEIAEVLKISIGQLVPLPHLPAWVMGVYNWRGNILWTIDLGQLLGLDSWYRQEFTSNCTVIILTSDRATSSAASLGLVVKRVEDIEWCHPDRLQTLPASTATPTSANYFKGYWLKDDCQTIFVLDSKAIFAAMPQSQNARTN